MAGYESFHDAVHWHMADITSRIIAVSGIPNDRFHLGKIILQSLKDNPDGVAQIEGTSGVSEKNSSLLKRTIQCAVALKKLGLMQGDVIVLIAPNHLDLAVPLYAALYLGIIVAPTDKLYTMNELAKSFSFTTPKIIFCQSEKVEDIRGALKGAELKTKVITFDQDGDINFGEFLENGNDSVEIEAFSAANFDPAETIAMLIPTSGTTGLPKAVAITHKNFAVIGPYFWGRTVDLPSSKRMLIMAPLHWLSTTLNYIRAPFMRFTRLQSNQTITREHAYELINKYKPSFLTTTPTVMMSFIAPGVRDKCDFTCFEYIALSGSAIYSNLLEELAEVAPKMKATNLYGISEVSSVAFIHGFSSPPESCGKPMGYLQYRLVDIETACDINEPNVNGELWLKGPGLFKEYYKNPEETKKAFVEGGWYKTGDLFYRDANWNFYFVERLKLLLEYKNYKISPVELEATIRRHPGVVEVAVTHVPDPDCWDLPVACIVPSPDNPPTAQEIKDLVKESLSDPKQLRGGVVFVKQLPLTASGKINRVKVRELALTSDRE